MSLRLVQLHRGNERRVALVDEPNLRLLRNFDSVYSLAMNSITGGAGLSTVVLDAVGSETLPYDDVYVGRSEWTLLPSADHSVEEARCLVSGTGLTHMASAARRDAMHAGSQELTDSMRMFRWGVEGGKPGDDLIGASPEWFYKGDGAVLRACNEALTIPSHAEDGGEEPEIAGVYLIASDGQPIRIGLTMGNEFSDHKFEKRNYLYLAASKLRECSIGPELVLDPVFDNVTGEVRVERDNAKLWGTPIQTGEANMCHSVGNMEHHHFKFAQHRRPGDVHIHFFGADAFSFGDGIELQTGDIMHVAFEGYGRALRNPVRVETGEAQRIQVRTL